VFQSAIFTIEKIDELIKTVPENSRMGIVLNAIKYGISKDSKNCYPFLAKFWDIPFGSDLFDMRKAGLISKILPDYDQYPEYCTYAKSFILNDNAAMYGPVKAVYRNQIESKDKSGISTYLYVSTANNYLMLGEFENALIYCDKEINGEGKPKYLKTFTPEVIKTKIKALLALDRNKEAVETAKKYSSPKKNYEMTSEEDGKQVEYKECAFIRNIAQDYCGAGK
jgi:triacylglycerol esterase/lipase EstA (alpha/beta hydrolase family)